MSAGTPHAAEPAPGHHHGAVSGGNLKFAGGARGAALLLALFAALMTVATAQAVASTLLIPSGTGLTQPTGMGVTSDGKLWVLDAELGLCRVDVLPSSPLVNHNDVCRVLRNTPDSAGQMVFDAVTANFYAADNKSNAGGIWRLHWSQATREIDDVKKIYEGGLTGVRVQGLALTPGGDLDFTNRSDTSLRRLPSPAAAVQGAVQFVGFSRAAGAVSLAYVGTDLYIAEGAGGGGVTTLANPQPGSGTATVVPGQPPGISPSALAGDTPNGRLYIGTSSGTSFDPVLALEGGTIATYDFGHANVTALDVSPDGTLFIADDPLSGVFGQDSIGQSRIFAEPFGPVNRPRVTITSAPAAHSNETTVTFAFQTRPGAHVECRFDGGPFTPCAGSFSVANVTEAAHLFEARATDDADPANIGAITQYGFAVDRTPPVVTIDNSPDDSVDAGGSMRLRFSADEADVSFTCSMNSEPPAACTSPRTYSGMQAGENVFQVWATDLAGNTSAPAVWRYVVHGGAQDASPRSAVQAQSTIACVAVGQRATAGRLWTSGARAVVSFTPPAGARFAKFTLRPSRRSDSIVETLGYRRIKARGQSKARLVLTRGQRSRLRRGTLRIAVSYGTCRTRVGGWRWADDRRSGEAGIRRGKARGRGR